MIRTKHVEDLIKALQDDDPEVRAKAARTLGRIRKIRIVVRAPKTDSMRSIRGRAKNKSKAMGVTRAVVPLLHALQDENSKVQEAAKKAIAKIQTQQPP